MSKRKAPNVLRAKGHALRLEWSGERGAEASSTGTCACGWEESASSQKEVRHEYRCHLMRVLGISWDPDQGAWIQAAPP